MLAQHFFEIRSKLKYRHLLKDDWDSSLIPLFSVLVNGPQFMFLIRDVLVQQIVGCRKVIDSAY